MDTKYYSAKVDFWLDEIEQEQETIPKYIENKQVSQVIDAFVFVFDKVSTKQQTQLLMNNDYNRQNILKASSCGYPFWIKQNRIFECVLINHIRIQRT